MKKTITLCAAILLIAISATAQFRLQTGDLLFQVGKSTPLTDAIEQVTSGAENVNYTHVGIVKIEAEKTYVIEATTPIVRKVPIDTFLNDARKINGKPIVAVGRLKAKYFGVEDDAATRAESCIGKNYDYVYAPDDKEIYCSELVYLSFIDKNGKPIFKPLKMTFRDSEGNMPKQWIEHFEKYKAPIPEGREGTNPGQLSKAKQINIVYRYF